MELEFIKTERGNDVSSIGGNQLMKRMDSPSTRSILSQQILQVIEDKPKDVQIYKDNVHSQVILYNVQNICSKSLFILVTMVC